MDIGRELRSRWTNLSTEVVVNTLDVVFAEICSRLHLNKDHICIADVANAMKVARLYLNRVTGRVMRQDAIEGDFGLSLDEVPVLGTVFMALVGQAFAGFNPNAFNLEERAFLEHLVTPPWADGTLYFLGQGWTSSVCGDGVRTKILSRIVLVRSKGY